MQGQPLQAHHGGCAQGKVPLLHATLAGDAPQRVRQPPRGAPARPVQPLCAAIWSATLLVPLWLCSKQCSPARQHLVNPRTPSCSNPEFWMAVPHVFRIGAVTGQGIYQAENSQGRAHLKGLTLLVFGPCTSWPTPSADALLQCRMPAVRPSSISSAPYAYSSQSGTCTQASRPVSPTYRNILRVRSAGGSIFDMLNTDDRASWKAKASYLLEGINATIAITVVTFFALFMDDFRLAALPTQLDVSCEYLSGLIFVSFPPTHPGAHQPRACR